MAKRRSGRRSERRSRNKRPTREPKGESGNRHASETVDSVGIQEPAADCGYPIDELDAETVRSLCESLGVATDATSVADRRRNLAAALGSPERWETWLAPRSAGALIVLEAVAEIGGPVYLEDLAELCLERGFTHECQVEEAIDEVAEEGLAAALGPPGGNWDTDALAPWQGSVAALACHVGGLSLPRQTPALEKAAAAEATGLREILAVASLTAHRRLRFTRTNAPDRTTLRTFSRGLGRTPDDVFPLVERAIAADLLRARGDRLVPSGERLRSVVSQEPAPGSVVALVPEQGWVSLESVARAANRLRLDASRANRGEPDPSSDGKPAVLFVRNVPRVLAQLRERIGREQSLLRSTVEGETWIRRAAEPSEPSGDGHVTPSFEVLLGPGASLDVVATIGLGCELMGLDRVLTFRITPESVAAGLGCGLDSARFLEALDHVGPHPLPETVRQLVSEWAERCRVVPAASGWFVFPGPELQPALQRSRLSPCLLGSPMPGVLAIAPDTPRQLLEAVLGEHGLALSLDHPMAAAQLQRESAAVAPGKTISTDVPRDDVPAADDAAAAPPAREPPWPLDATGAPALRQRVEAARPSGYTVERHAAEPPPVHVVPGIRAGDTGALGAQEADPQLDALFETASRLVPGATRELQRFGRKLPADQRRHLEDAISMVLPLLPFFALKPKWQRRIAREAEDLVDLLELSVECCDLGRTSPLGRVAMDMAEARFDLDSDPEDLDLTDLEPEADGAREIEIRFDGPEGDFPPPRLVGSGRAPSRQGPNVRRTCHIPHPEPDDFPQLDRGELMARLADLVKRNRNLFVLVRKAGDVVRHLRGPRIRLEGQRQVLLAEDVDTGDDRAIPLRTIASVLAVYD